MKKIVLAIFAASIIGACGLIPSPTNPAPTVDIQGTNDAGMQTAAAQTLAAQPTVTMAPVNEPFTPTLEGPVLNDTITPALPSQELITTPITATSEVVVTPTLTATAIVISGAATQTPTLGILTYGTLPPAVPSNSVTLINRSKAQAYISLQQQDDNGAILEYPVKGQFIIKAPIGRYIYVAWVGGKKMTGSFSLNAFKQVTIILYKDKIVIQHN